MHNSHLIVAVDGPAGSGKSSVSREVARKKELTYIDSGALYRAVTLYFMEQLGTVPQVKEGDMEQYALQLAQKGNDDGTFSTFLNGRDVSSDIRDETVTAHIGAVSDQPAIRSWIVSVLREWSGSHSVIMDGRDIGTVVFPTADLKVYMDASVEARLSRRLEEYRLVGKNVDENILKKQIIQRDKEDRSRPVGALIQADDAMYLDTSAMSFDEVVAEICRLITTVVKNSDTVKQVEKSSGWDEMVEEQNEHNEMMDMQELLDSSLEEIQPGKVISGEVVTIDDSYVYVNVGTKSDGRVPAGEFEELPAVGDSIEVMLQTRRFVDGMYQFSMKAAHEMKFWKEFSENNAEGDSIKGFIQKSTNKGKMVNCGGFVAFLPFSLAADLKGISSSEEEYTFRIKTIDKKKRSVVLSRRDYIEEENAKNWEAFVSQYKEGDVIEGEVVKFVEFGAFINVGGIDALLHRNDMTWKKVFKQRKLLKLGEKREFKILSINREEGKISLGLKQLKDDPWKTVTERYKTGDIAEGTVVTLTNFGAFVEIEEGVEGFLSNNELSWTKRNASVNDIFEKGDTGRFMVLDVNPDDQKMTLGLKQTMANPWESIDERFPVGSSHTRPIKKIVKFGFFVELEESIDGLVHNSDITWDDKVKNPQDGFSEGDEVTFKILEIRKGEQKISCGIKQLTESPWEAINKKYPPRSKVEGVISGITDFGVFIKLEDDVEGLVHISEVSRRRIDDLSEHFTVGDRVHAVVLGVDVNRKRLSLSIKHLEIMSEKEELSKILKKESPSTMSLGNMIKIELNDEEKNGSTDE